MLTYMTVPVVQCQLLERFPVESGAKDPAARMIPFLPGIIIGCPSVFAYCLYLWVSISPSSGKKLFGRSQTRTVAEKRRDKIDLYCRVSNRKHTTLHVHQCHLIHCVCWRTCTDFGTSASKDFRRFVCPQLL